MVIFYDALSLSERVRHFFLCLAILAAIILTAFIAATGGGVAVGSTGRRSPTHSSNSSSSSGNCNLSNASCQLSVSTI